MVGDPDGGRPRPLRRGHGDPDAAVPLALRVLGLDGRATAADVKRAFRRHALAAHPDQGGTSHAFRALLASYVEALELVGEAA